MPSFTMSKRRLAGIGAAAAAAALAIAAPAMAADPTPGTPPTAPEPVPTPPPVAPTDEPTVPTIVTPVLTMRPGLGPCRVDNVCLYYFSSARSTPFGSLYQTPHNEPNLRDNHFRSAGPGQGQIVANNAEAVWNRGNIRVKLCKTRFYGGDARGNPRSCLSIPPGIRDLPPGYSNNVESILWTNSSN